MKIKKIVLSLLLILFVTGCSKVNDMTYDEIINNFATSKNSANTYRRGYKYFLPKGVSLNYAGANYAILDSSDNYYYYLFIDLIGYINKTEINTTKTSNYIYSKVFNCDNKIGYIYIKNAENDKYMIEIMYNYAKIELMVDSKNVKESIINSTSILKSIVYDDKVIEALLKDDNLTYTEENFNMFDKLNKKSGVLNYNNEENEIIRDVEIIDTDLIN